MQNNISLNSELNCPHPYKIQFHDDTEDFVVPDISVPQNQLYFRIVHYFFDQPFLSLLLEYTEYHFSVILMIFVSVDFHL